MSWLAKQIISPLGSVFQKGFSSLGSVFRSGVSLPKIGADILYDVGNKMLSNLASGQNIFGKQLNPGMRTSNLGLAYGMLKDSASKVIKDNFGSFLPTLKRVAQSELPGLQLNKIFKGND